VWATWNEYELLKRVNEQKWIASFVDETVDKNNIMRSKDAPVVIPRKSVLVSSNNNGTTNNGNGTSSPQIIPGESYHTSNGNGVTNGSNGRNGTNGHHHNHQSSSLVELNPKDHHDIKVVIRNGRIVAGEDTLPFKKNRMGKLDSIISRVIFNTRLLRNLLRVYDLCEMWSAVFYNFEI